jgi:hypothetical protein
MKVRGGMSTGTTHPPPCNRERQGPGNPIQDSQRREHEEAHNEMSKSDKTPSPSQKFGSVVTTPGLPRPSINVLHSMD